MLEGRSEFIGRSKWPHNSENKNAKPDPRGDTQIYRGVKLAKNGTAERVDSLFLEKNSVVAVPRTQFVSYLPTLTPLEVWTSPLGYGFAFCLWTSETNPQ